MLYIRYPLLHVGFYEINFFLLLLSSLYYGAVSSTLPVCQIHLKNPKSFSHRVMLLVINIQFIVFWHFPCLERNYSNSTSNCNSSVNFCSHVILEIKIFLNTLLLILCSCQCFENIFVDFVAFDIFFPWILIIVALSWFTCNCILGVTSLSGWYGFLMS